MAAAVMAAAVIAAVVVAAAVRMNKHTDFALNKREVAGEEDTGS
jgi:hypothetical protein